MNKEIDCKTHPNAPHGFVRNASHTEDRYVCECEYWEEPKVNERIKELANEAEEYAARVTTGDWEVGLAYQDLFNKKFAELIVAECMRLNSKELSITAIERLLPLYAEHFGIEL